MAKAAKVATVIDLIDLTISQASDRNTEHTASMTDTVTSVTESAREKGLIMRNAGIRRADSALLILIIKNTDET